MDGNHKSLWGMVNLSILQQKKHCHCQFYIFSKLSHEILNCHSFDNFFTHFCIPVDCTRLIVQSQDSVILFYSLEQHWDCVNNWKTRYTMILWLLKEGFLGDCKIIWPSQLSWWCELATVESFYSRYFVNPFSSDKGSILKKSALETWDQYQYLGNCSPTPFLTQQQSIDNKLRLMLS